MLSGKPNDPVRAKESDFDEITEIWEASVRATHTFLTEEDITYFKPLVRNEYLKLVNLFLLRDDHRIAGFVGTHEDKIEMLFLDPERIGQGLGRRLCEFAIHKLKADKVDVNEQNPGAVAFYEHMGFRTIGRSPLDPQGKPFPILHMAL